jgi:hypothetical protein
VQTTLSSHLGIATAAAILVGCSGAPEPASEARTWDGAFLLDQIVIECDTQSWTYDVTTAGWGSLVTVDVVARSPGVRPWVEHHELPEVDYGEGWARHTLELDQATSEAEYEPSGATWIGCEAKTFVTYGFAAWRFDGELEECVAWGLDPAGEFPDCAAWGTVEH